MEESRQSFAVELCLRVGVYRVGGLVGGAGFASAEEKFLCVLYFSVRVMGNFVVIQ